MAQVARQRAPPRAVPRAAPRAAPRVRRGRVASPQHTAQLDPSWKFSSCLCLAGLQARHQPHSIWSSPKSLLSQAAPALTCCASHLFLANTDSCCLELWLLSDVMTSFLRGTPPSPSMTATHNPAELVTIQTPRATPPDNLASGNPAGAASGSWATAFVPCHPICEPCQIALQQPEPIQMYHEVGKKRSKCLTHRQVAASGYRRPHSCRGK
mmetsp:Transcript_1144/g.1993  ORF Transcript_1144/g.1993 Transcript_1144/m.1993 type:complete len:211 (-) Transcript_1144:222-854(-)